MKGFQITIRYVQVTFLLTGILFILLAASKPISDFGNYYYGAKFYLRGLDPSSEIYDVMKFNQHVEQEGEKEFFLNYCTVTPQSLFLYTPFAWISNAALAKVIFNLSGLFLFVYVFGRFLKRFCPHPDWKLMCVAVAALIPFFYNIVFGQTYLLVATLLMGTVLQYEKRPLLAGVFLSIAISLKVAPVIFLLWFITERKWKVVVSTAVFWILPALACTLSFPRVMHDFYFGSLPRMGMGFVTDPYTSSFQGIIVLLRKLMSPDAILNPQPLLSGSEGLVHFIEIIVFLVLSVLLIGAWKNNKGIREKFLLLILFMNIVSGYSSTYSFLLLLPFISFTGTTRDWTRVLLYCIVFMFPSRLFDGYSPFLEEYKLWILLVLLLLETSGDWGFRHLEKPQLLLGLIMSAFIIFRLSQRPEVMPLTYYHPEEAKQDYVLSAYAESTTITYVTSIPEGFAQYSFNTKGEQGWTPQTSAEFYTRGVHIRMIAFRGDEALVLSDYHRGPGLFHLYTIMRRDLENLMH